MAVECLVVWLLSSNLDPVDKSQNQDTTALSVSSVATFPPCSDDVQCIVYFSIYFLTGFGDETGGQEQRGRLSRWSTWSRPDGCSSPPPTPPRAEAQKWCPLGPLQWRSGGSQGARDPLIKATVHTFLKERHFLESVQLGAIPYQGKRLRKGVLFFFFFHFFFAFFFTFALALSCRRFCKSYQCMEVCCLY